MTETNHTETNHTAQQKGTPEERVIIFDTTLRDGEQSPGMSMRTDAKVKVAETLDKMGVDVIEAGFPIASKGDFKAVQKVAKKVKNMTVCALARATEKDIDRAAEAIKKAERRRIHTFISTSPVHMKYKLQMEPEAVLEAIKFSVKHARKYTDDVEWSPEDATRTEPDFLCKSVEIAIKAGATTINIPDTVGYTLPREYYKTILMLQKRVPNMDQVVISTHCHNDLGLAVANSLEGVRAGARQVECTINGVGERAGNAALEEVVMAMNVRHDLMPQWTDIDTTKLNDASKLVSSVMAVPVQYNKAIIGQNAFAHESGIHQDGMLKNTQTYSIMLPKSVGISQTSLVMGKHSGRHALRRKIIEMGYQLEDDEFKEVFSRFKDLADKEKNIFNEDITALIGDGEALCDKRIKVVSLYVETKLDGKSTAKGELKIDDKIIEFGPMTSKTGPVDAIFKAINKAIKKAIKKRGHIEDGPMTSETSETGPVDAIFKAINKAIKKAIKKRGHIDVTLFDIRAATEGTGALAEVEVRLSDRDGGKTTTGRGDSKNMLVACMNAHIDAWNKHIDEKSGKEPDDIATLGI